MASPELEKLSILSAQGNAPTQEQINEGVLGTDANESLPSEPTFPVVAESSDAARSQAEKDMAEVEEVAKFPETKTEEKGEEKEKPKREGGLTRDEAMELFGTDFTGVHLDTETGLFFPDAVALERLSGPEAAAQSVVDTGIAEIDTFIEEIEDLRVSLKSQNEALIKSIREQFGARKSQIADINKRSLGMMKTLGFRLGTTRYSPGVHIGFISAEERAGAQKLAELDAEEARLISEAQIAATKEDFSMLREKLDLAEQKREEQQAVLEKQAELAAEQAEKLREANEEFGQDVEILSAWTSGIKDPTSIFAFVNFDAQGNEVNNISIDKIKDTITGLDEEEKSSKASAQIQEYLDAQGSNIIGEDITFFEWRQMKAQADKVIDPTKDAKESAKDFMSFRSTVRQEESVKKFEAIKIAYNSVKAGYALDDASGDLAMVSGIARMLDPGSVVRPSEFETVREAQGWLENVFNLGARVAEGRIVVPGGRIRLFRLANTVLLNNVEPLKSSLETTYKPLASSMGISFEQAVPEARQFDIMLQEANIALEELGPVDSTPEERGVSGGAQFITPDNKVWTAPNDLSPEEENELLRAGYIKR